MQLTNHQQKKQLLKIPQSRIVPALTSCIPRSGVPGKWKKCQRLWLFNVSISDGDNKIVHLKSRWTIHQINLPVKIRLAVPKMNDDDLIPYIVAELPDMLSGAEVDGCIDGTISIRGIYSDSLADLTL